MPAPSPYRHRQLNYGTPLPQDWMDAIQDFIGALLVNFRLQIIPGGSGVQVPAGVGNDQAGAGIEGKWRYNSVTAQAAHPGGVAGTYDVWVTGTANSFTSGGPSGEIDNTDYSFGLQITGVTPPTTALKRKVAQVIWDGAKVVRIVSLAGNISLTATDFVALIPETAARNTMSPAGDFVMLTLKRLAGQTADLQQWQTDTGGLLANLTAWGMFTPVGGTVLPVMTTAQRDALVAGRRPKGLQVFNSDTSTVEVNTGTDATPVWLPAGGYGAGIILDFAGQEANIPARTVVTDGRQLAIASEPAAFARIGIEWNTFGGLPAPPGGFFRVPDLRGRGTVGKGDMGAGNGTTPAATGTRIQRSGITTLATLMGEEFHALTIPEMPSHNHGGVTGTESVTHTHTDSGHTHVITEPNSGQGHRHALGTLGNGSASDDDTVKGHGAAFFSAFATTGISLAAGAAAIGINSTSHTHVISSQGGGGAHENVHPVAVVNKVMTL